MFVEIPAHHLHHVPDLDWDVHSYQKISRDCFSHSNFVLDQALLFCTEKIILSKKLTKKIQSRNKKEPREGVADER